MLRATGEAGSPSALPFSPASGGSAYGAEERPQTINFVPVVGAIILVVCMLLFFPLIFVIGGVTMGVLGWAAQTEVEDANEGSELIELNN